ncbi:MAG: glycosyltransferase family 2 protein [Bacilli bacterium]
MKTELISIVVILKNSDTDLKKTLSSILKQTYSNLEILIIIEKNYKLDKNIIKFVNKDKRIKVICKKGEYNNKVFGYKKAKGKYLLYVETGDFIEKNMIEIMYNNLLQYDVDIVHSQHKIFHNGSYEIPKNILNRNVKMNLAELEPKFFDLLYKTGNCDGVTKQLIKKKIMDNVTNVSNDLIYFSDLVINIEIYKKMNSILFIPDELYVYENSSNKIRLEIEESIKQIEDMLNIYYLLYKSIDEFKIKDRKHYKMSLVIRILMILNSLIYELKKSKNMNKKQFLVEINKIIENDKIKKIFKYLNSNKEIADYLKRNDKMTYFFVQLFLNEKVKTLYYFYLFCFFKKIKINDTII